MAFKDKDERALKALMREPENKRCFDCGEPGPFYVCLDFGTFICTQCSGLHREFNHRVKSTSMATFKPDELEKLKRNGNAIARKIWLGRWDPNRYPPPDSNNAAKVKEFMRLKYIDKHFYVPPNGSAAPVAVTPAATGQLPPVEPLSNILGNQIPSVVQPSQQPSQSYAQPQQPYQPPPPNQSFYQQAARTQQQQQHQQQTSFFSQAAPAKPQPQAQSFNLLDLDAEIKPEQEQRKKQDELLGMLIGSPNNANSKPSDNIWGGFVGSPSGQSRQSHHQGSGAPMQPGGMGNMNGMGGMGGMG
eukprot:CAMPEP_0177657998 /NCGR_PEP_ID=MMETSP0447-20121125/16551_1 /TAXON_ID=0 /ORGANISM="Stygamoeba regulata, Strain BSH-02190019" /LENGTH=301 /DNA_ID=CAMNT_0019162525 /DNA_START=76 /DNA_END=978 /DNA_ORIENTATION=+